MQGIATNTDRQSVILGKLNEARQRVRDGKDLVYRGDAVLQKEQDALLQRRGGTLREDDRMRLSRMKLDLEQEKTLLQEMRAAFLAALALGIRRVTDIMQQCMISMNDIIDWQRDEGVVRRRDRMLGTPLPAV